MVEKLASMGEYLPTPDVDDWLLGVWRAWHRLGQDRPWLPVGMGAPIPARITWSALAEWCAFHGADLAFYDVCIRAMEDVYMTWQAEHRKT